MTPKVRTNIQTSVTKLAAAKATAQTSAPIRLVIRRPRRSTMRQASGPMPSIPPHRREGTMATALFGAFKSEAIGSRMIPKAVGMPSTMAPQTKQVAHITHP